MPCVASTWKCHRASSPCSSGPRVAASRTLLRTIAGLEDTNEGSIEIAGKDVTYVRPRDRDIAMVFQNYALYPYMNVYENIAFGLRARKFAQAEIDKRVKRAAEMLGIGPLLERLPRQLSGGQRQRVAIGRAIVRDARLFLFDEPLSNLDAQLRDDMRSEIKRLHQDIGRTMIYVTHDQIEAMTLADRIVLLRDGKIEQAGPPLELYEQPATRFVAGFLGSPKMNFIPARILSDAAGGELLDLGRRRSDQIAFTAAALERGHSRYPAAAYRHCEWRRTAIAQGRLDDRTRPADGLTHADHVPGGLDVGRRGSRSAFRLQAGREG